MNNTEISNGSNVHLSNNVKLGRNIILGDNIFIEENVTIGDNVIVKNNVRIKQNTIVSDGVTLGEPSYKSYFDRNHQYRLTKIGENSLIRSGSIIYEGVQTGTNFNSGHRLILREDCKIGNYCSIGSNSDIQESVFIDNYSRIHSSVIISKNAQVGKFVFIYPFTVFTEDPFPPSDEFIAPKILDYAQIAVSSTILPGVSIGKHALVGAGSVCTKSVKDFSIVYGNPARPQGDVRNLVHPENKKQLYPWPKRFSRGMPWHNIGYEKWMNEQH